MGFHVCEYCVDGKPSTSSGDVLLCFEDGNSWVVPDMILHYVAAHAYVPCDEFVEEIMSDRRLNTVRLQAKGAVRTEGYLSGAYNKGTVPEGFFMRLWLLMERANKNGTCWRARGV